MDTWWGFAFRLISKYNNGYICLNEEEFGPRASSLTDRGVRAPGGGGGVVRSVSSAGCLQVGASVNAPRRLLQVGL